MRKIKAKVKSIDKIKPNIFLIKFKSAYLAQNAYPGQFMQVKIERSGILMRRPFSIHKIEKDTVNMLFKIRGRGTKALSCYRQGDELDLIGPLGKGFEYDLKSAACQNHIFIAGGIGIAPLVFLSQEIDSGIANPQKIFRRVFLGAKNKKEILCEDYFKKAGYQIKVATDDGSKGAKAKITELFKRGLKSVDGHTNIYACGPKEMFFELARIIKPSLRKYCQVSFEQFMGCGVGVCSACVIETKSGYKKVCKEGPVFCIEEIF